VSVLAGFGLLLVVAGSMLVTRPGSVARVLEPRPTRTSPAGPFVRRRSRDQRAVVELVGHLRAELLAGAALRPALQAAAAASREQVCPTAVAACAMGADVAAALREDGRRYPLLLSLAALWEVSESSGAALATALDRLVSSGREAAAVRAELAAQLAGPRATARVLASLPVVGIGMGLLMGADPLGFLLATPWGWSCLVAAGVLETVGVVWVRALVKGVEDRL
jgi:tight adherence protein B